MKYKVKSIANLGTVCPTQWQGLLKGNIPFFVRYRFGNLTVYVSRQEVSPRFKGCFSFDLANLVFNEQVGDDMDGCMNLNQLKEHLPDWDFTGVTEINK